MKIHSLTAFTPASWPIDNNSLVSLGRFLTDARPRLEKTGLPVESINLATPPFLDVIGDPAPSALLAFANIFESLAEQFNLDRVSLGPVLASTPLSLIMSIHALPELLNQTKRIYASVLFADSLSGVNLTAAHALAQIIHKIAHAHPDGATSLRLSALTNVGPNFPYLPAAYHQGGLPAFSLAVDVAHLALHVFTKARNLADAQRDLIRGLENVATRILNIVDELVDDHQIEFKGLDFSLSAPPQPSKSIESVLHALGVDIGHGSGSLFAVKFITDSLHALDIPHVGFTGVSYSALGVASTGEAPLTVNDVLMQTAAGSTGLDSTLLPGDTTPEQLTAILLDMATLSIAQSRPLIARLVPLPTHQAGDSVTLAGHNRPSQVLELRPSNVQPLLERGTHYTSTIKRDRRRARAETTTIFTGFRPKK